MTKLTKAEQQAAVEKLQKQSADRFEQKCAATRAAKQEMRAAMRRQDSKGKR